MLKDKAEIFNPRVLTQADAEEVRSGKAYIMVLGRIEYLDVYSSSHWIDYCRWKSLSVGNFFARKCVELTKLMTRQIRASQTLPVPFRA